MDRQHPTTAYLGLGANLGDRQEQLAAARVSLAAAPGVRVTAASPLYETAPVGGPPGQPDYLNAVLEAETTLPAEALLALCQQIEAAGGRSRAERWGARTIDLDLLLYGGAVIDAPDLVVPHPELHRRRFALVPLADLAPGLVHPVLGRSVSELLSELPDDGAVRLFAREW
jgi:2-amino-4-hydroxy-6-hydroxymethyldihydropteridine diphosphokinase